ncbi:MAG: suppressor of fused domain protein [Gammaproteobacteria bacterium]|nr:suppressor of fused domain protein [Gammaproteobacteria bacterium]
MENNERLRAGISMHMFENASIKGSLSLSHYEFGSGKKYHTAYGLIGDDADPIQAVFSMPNDSSDVYMMISDGDPEVISEVLAGIQNYNEEKEHVCLFHTVPTLNDTFVTKGWNALLILLPCTVLDNFEDNKEIDGRNINFRLVMPITNIERQYKIDNDIEALLDQFEDNDRDIISFVQ